MAYRVSFFFTMQGDRIGGWSENFWNNGSSIDQVAIRSLSLASTLQFVKGDQAYCPRFRISTVPGFRLARTVIRIGASPRLPITDPNVATASSSDYITTKWLLRLSSGNIQTTQWLGGMTDESILNGGFLNQGRVTAAGFPRLRARLIDPAEGWCTYSLTMPPNRQILSSIDPVTGIVTTANPPPAPGDLIRISGVRGLVYANRLWRVLAVSPPDITRFQLQGWTGQTVSMAPSKQPTYRVQQYGPVPISQAEIIRSSNHRAGRPTGQLGGRPKRRKIA